MPAAPLASHQAITDIFFVGKISRDLVILLAMCSSTINFAISYSLLGATLHQRSGVRLAVCLLWPLRAAVHGGGYPYDCLR